MNQTSSLRASARWLAAGVGVTAAAYGAYVGITWLHYGDAAPPSPEEQDPLLDRFMPSYDVAERHHVRVAVARERSEARMPPAPPNFGGVLFLSAAAPATGAAPAE